MVGEILSGWMRRLFQMSAAGVVARPQPRAMAALHAAGARHALGVLLWSR